MLWWRLPGMMFCHDTMPATKKKSPIFYFLVDGHAKLAYVCDLLMHQRLSIANSWNSYNMQMAMSNQFHPEDSRLIDSINSNGSFSSSLILRLLKFEKNVGLEGAAKNEVPSGLEIRKVLARWASIDSNDKMRLSGWTFLRSRFSHFDSIIII